MRGIGRIAGGTRLCKCGKKHRKRQKGATREQRMHLLNRRENARRANSAFDK